MSFGETNLCQAVNCADISRIYLRGSLVVLGRGLHLTSGQRNFASKRQQPPVIRRLFQTVLNGAGSATDISPAQISDSKQLPGIWVLGRKLDGLV